jgi:hypothetical protein
MIVKTTNKNYTISIKKNFSVYIFSITPVNNIPDYKYSLPTFFKSELQELHNIIGKALEGEKI